MRLYFCGTGTLAFDLSRQHASLVVEHNSTRLLFDAGRGVTTQLLKLGLSPLQIDALFITHHHYDHICDMGEFIMANWHNGRVDPFFIFGPPETNRIVTVLMDEVFSRDIKFTRELEPGMPDIHQLFRTTDILPEWTFTINDLTIRSNVVDHGSASGFTYAEWPCHGYRIESSGSTIVISGDAVESPGLINLAENADILVQCCYQVGSDPGPAQSIIASARQAGIIARKAGVGRLILTHIPPQSDVDLKNMLAEVQREYKGEINLAVDLMEISL